MPVLTWVSVIEALRGLLPHTTVIADLIRNLLRLVVYVPDCLDCGSESAMTVSEDGRNDGMLKAMMVSVPDCLDCG